jgi:hypothetical protein
MPQVVSCTNLGCLDNSSKGPGDTKRGYWHALCTLLVTPSYTPRHLIPTLLSCCSIPTLLDVSRHGRIATLATSSTSLPPHSPHPQDMAGQMEVLQGQLRVQGSLASKLRAELASVAADSAAAREVADATEAALRWVFRGRGKAQHGRWQLACTCPCGSLQ